MGTMTEYRKLIMMIAVAVLLTLGLTPSTSAQTLNDCTLFGINCTNDPTNMKITCTGGTTCSTANVGGTQLQISTSSLPTFTVSNTGTTGLPAAPNDTGTAFVVVLVPDTASMLTFTANSDMPTLTTSWTTGGMITRFAAIGITPFQTADPPIQPFLTATQALDPAAAGFTVYLFDIGSFTDGTVINVSFSGIAGLPVGTIFWSFLTENSGLAINSTPISQSLQVVPEPTTLLLFGSGLLSMGGLLRWRTKKRP